MLPRTLNIRLPASSIHKHRSIRLAAARISSTHNRRSIRVRPVDIRRQAAPETDRHSRKIIRRRPLPLATLLPNPLLPLHLLRFTTITFRRSLASLDVISQGR
jgi:hypothetical protein